MKIQILHEAETEFIEAISYYENIEFGLGLRLKEKVRQAIAWIQINYALPRVTAKGYQRVNIKVFPYYIAFFACGDTVFILAVAHAHRRPEYWIERKKNLK